MADAALKRAIKAALSGFPGRPLAGAARTLLETLGYRSDKRLDFVLNTAAEFQAQSEGLHSLVSRRQSGVVAGTIKPCYDPVHRSPHRRRWIE